MTIDLQGAGSRRLRGIMPDPLRWIHGRVGFNLASLDRRNEDNRDQDFGVSRSRARPDTLHNGYWQIPEGPGLGVEVDEKAIAMYPFKQEIMHAGHAVLDDGTIVDW